MDGTIQHSDAGGGHGRDKRQGVVGSVARACWCSIGSKQTGRYL